MARVKRGKYERWGDQKKKKKEKEKKGRIFFCLIRVLKRKIIIKKKGVDRVFPFPN